MVTSATLRDGRSVITGDEIGDGSLVCNKFSELFIEMDSSGVAKFGCCVGAGGGGCFFECNGDGGTGETDLGVRLTRRGCVVNDVSMLFDDVPSFLSLTGGGGIIPCFGSIFNGTGRDTAISVTVSGVDDGAGALRLTTFADPGRVAADVDLMGPESTIDVTAAFCVSLESTIGFIDFAVDAAESVLVI